MQSFDKISVLQQEMIWGKVEPQEYDLDFVLFGSNDPVSNLEVEKP